MKRKILSIILSLVMLLTMIPTMVFASEESLFTDVTSSAFYFDAVLWAVNHNPQITKGTSAMTFSPGETCTRGQVVTFLWRAAGQPEPSSLQNPFTDVKEDAYYYDAVLWAVENGITTGTSKTTFSPAEGCTRGQVVTFLYRTVKEPSVENVVHSFRDLSDNGYYYKAVLWAVANKVTTGTSATTFSPSETCTRGQIVTFLHRAKDLLTESHLSDEEIEKEIETVANLNQDLADIESEYIITDNAQETADHAVTIMQKMLDYCSKQKEAGEILDYEQDGCLIIIQLRVGKFIYEFQLFPGLQGGSFGSASALSSQNQETESFMLSERAQLLSDSFNLSRIATFEPYKEDFNTDIYDNAAQSIENAGLGYEFALNANSETVTVELAKRLDDYKVIIWNGHGCYSEDDGMHSVLGLGEICSKEKNKEYKDYLNSSQLVYMGGSKTDYGKAHYAVTTKFFDECYDSGSFKDSLIFLGTCCSAKDPYLEQTFINKGAKAVLGYSTLVHPDYNQAMFKTIFEELVKKDESGKTCTVKHALETAKRKNGSRDPKWTENEQALVEIFIPFGWLIERDSHAELILHEKDENSSFRLSDNGGEGQEQSGTVDLGSANIGDYVTFGHYEQDNDTSNGKEAIEWKVLDKKDGRALLLSKYVLSNKGYHETWTDVTWETCTLRSWLNSDFLNEAFSSAEQSAIPTVTLSNPDNPNYETEGGNNTIDRVFLLSLQEIQQYFILSDTWTDYDGGSYDVTGNTKYIGGSKDVITSPTAYAEAQGVEIYSSRHDAEGKASCYWWLRSPGYTSDFAACVSPHGHVDASGDLVDNYDYVSVRPALWVNLAS